MSQMSIVPWIKITWALIPHIVRSPELWKLWNCALLTSHHVVAHFGTSPLAALIQMWTPVGVFREYLISVPESYVEHKSYVEHVLCRSLTCVLPIALQSCSCRSLSSLLLHYTRCFFLNFTKHHECMTVVFNVFSEVWEK